jgi:hypothetical protein
MRTAFCRQLLYLLELIDVASFKISTLPPLKGIDIYFIVTKVKGLKVTNSGWLTEHCVVISHFTKIVLQILMLLVK